MMIGITIIAFAISFFFKEVPVAKHKEKLHILQSIKNQYVVSFKFVKEEKKVLFLSIVLNIMGAFVLISFYYMQNYWKAMGTSEFLIGLVLGIHSAIAAFGGYSAHKIEKGLGEKKIIISVSIIMAALYWLLYFPLMSFIVVMVIGFIDSLFYVVLSSYINHMIPSEQRATLLSFSSMIFSVIMITFFPSSGLYGRSYWLEQCFLDSSWFTNVDCCENSI